MKRIIIIGATSGIGAELARQYLEQGAIVGGCGRREHMFKELTDEFKQHFYSAKLDISNFDSIADKLNALIDKMGGLDILIISASVSLANPNLDWNIENKALSINVNGYAACAIFAANYFKKQGHGHLVGISSIAKFFGNRNPAYSASKAFESIYLEGLRLGLEKYQITVSEIYPGFVGTPMVAGRSKMFWLVAVEKAGRQIIRAIEKKKRQAYVSRRWLIFKYILPLLPYGILRRVL